MKKALMSKAPVTETILSNSVYNFLGQVTSFDSGYFPDSGDMTQESMLVRSNITYNGAGDMVYYHDKVTKPTSDKVDEMDWYAESYNKLGQLSGYKQTDVENGFNVDSGGKRHEIQHSGTGERTGVDYKDSRLSNQYLQCGTPA